jgi:hypothetical protein
VTEVIIGVVVRLIDPVGEAGAGEWIDRGPRFHPGFVMDERDGDGNGEGTFNNGAPATVSIPSTDSVATLPRGIQKSAWYEPL